MNEKFVQRIGKEVEEIQSSGLYKTERTITGHQGAEIKVAGKTVLNFCANNYLGLSSHPKVIDAAIKAIEDHGYGMSSVRFICGTQDIHKAARAPTQWETGNLFPPPNKTTWAQDPRIAALQAQMDAAAPTDPMVAQGLHIPGALLPDECNSFIGPEFWSPNLAVMANLPRYSEWLRWAAPARPYLTHRWVLQHLQHYGPSGRWTLKSPFHVHALPAFLAEYPNAVFVQTHRAPTALMPSMCGLYCTIRGEGPGDPRRAVTGKELCAVWGTGMQRAMSARLDPALNARVFDVSHRSMIEDPMGTVRSVYTRFDLPFSAAAEAAVAAWLANPAQHMSKVKFTLADFGLDEDEVTAAFGPYSERYKDYF